MLKKLFSKKDLQTFDKLGKEFESVLKKSKSTFLSLVGVGGKVKGLELVVCIDEDSGLSKKDVQRINVKLVEYYLRFQSLPIKINSSSDPEDEFVLPLKHVCYSFGESHKYYIIPLELNNTLIVTARTPDIDKILKQIHRISQLLSQLEEERKG